MKANAFSQRFSILNVIRSTFIKWRALWICKKFDTNHIPPYHNGKTSLISVFMHEWKMHRNSVNQHNNLGKKIRDGIATREELVAYAIGTKKGREKLVEAMIDPIRKKIDA